MKMSKWKLCMAILFISILLVISACSPAPVNHSADFATEPMHEWREMHGLSSPRLFAPSPSAPAPPASAPMAATGQWAADSAFMVREEAEVFRHYGDFLNGAHAQRTPRRIKIGHMTMESENVESAAMQFEQMAFNFGGWVESRSINTGVRTFADLTLRVPATLYDEFVIVVSEIGRVRSFNDNVIDATEEYFDSQTRLNINRAEEARLLEFIENSVNLEDIILLESRLSDVRMEIELHEGNMRRISRAVSYSTLHVHLIEHGAPVIRPVAMDLGGRMGAGFTGSVSAVTNFLQNLVVFLAYVSVPLVIFGVCALVGLYMNKKRKRKKEGITIAD